MQDYPPEVREAFRHILKDTGKIRTDAEIQIEAWRKLIADTAEMANGYKATHCA